MKHSDVYSNFQILSRCIPKTKLEHSCNIIINSAYIWRGRLNPIVLGIQKKTNIKSNWCVGLFSAWLYSYWSDHRPCALSKNSCIIMYNLNNVSHP